MISTIQKKKILLLFDVLDINKNGELQPDDFERVATKISDVKGYSEHSTNRLNLKVKSFRLFIQLLTDMQKEEASISKEEWLYVFENVLLPNERKIKGYVHRTAAYIFSLFDSNGDRVVSLNEYLNMFSVYGLEDEYAIIAFKKLDLNGDGVLQFYEVVQAFYDFFLSDSETVPGNWIFGNFDLVEA
ncbi:EF-hand domain-containing protein [Marinoscillum sp. MHG1-6]|uniref:EF-hand domain-containing protein n=1 Tax=Marinoscillum sp. MHG1-6 TaxID=2959627 RepID=UPI002157D543|nr:EF-hand domain-containing protein [Marinoscillum sp. MHG1-6]